MAANTPIAKLPEKVQSNVISLYRACATNFLGSWNIREQLLEADRLYMRERDWTAETAKAKVANRSGDPTKFRNIEVPVVMSTVEAAVTYQSSVFLTGVPIFGVSSSAQYMDAALQMESIIDDQAIKGGWVRQLGMALRDGFKYTFGCVDVDWTRKKIFTPTTNLSFSSTQAEPVETYWEGNTLKRVDPYNIIFDPRYSPAEMAERGDFAGYTELYSRIEFIRFMQALSVHMNYKIACESGPSQVGAGFPSDYYIPQLNPQALINQSVAGEINWLQWAGLETSKNSGINFKNSYYVTKFYARIIPFDLGMNTTAPHVPQIWKFYVVNGQVLVYAERQSNAHDRIPMLFMQPLEDGLGYQTKSLAQNSAPFQSVGSALVNSSIASRRRALADRGLYDPSRVDQKHINNDSASAKIPVKPAAYGKPLSEAYYPIPYRDEQSAQAMSDLQVMMSLNDQTSGQNRAQQGQFVKGNKTLFEYQDVMANANARPQNTALLLEDQFFSPLKEILKSNVLQYQGPSSVFNRETAVEVTIDPVALRKAALVFKVSDGEIPAAKQMNTEAFQSACQTLASVPQLASAYNMGPMFSYLFKQQRADVAQFEKSPQLLQYEQAVSQWQGAIQSLAETYSKLKKADGTSYTPEEIQKALPPQPTPDQFGVDPNNPYATKPKAQGTILQQVEQVNAATSQ